MKKHTVVKRLLASALALSMALSLAACGNGENQNSEQPNTPSENVQASDAPEQESQPAVEPAYNTNYKGKTTYEDIAEQLRADLTLDLNGLDSQMFKITGYAQGYNFDDAWFGSLGQMVNSGEQVVLAAGSSQFAFNFGGLARTAEETDIRVGGIDSLTPEFADLLDGGVYDFCSGSYPSMIGPALALTLRALEGNRLTDAGGLPVAINMSHMVANSAEELSEIMAEDSAGNYAYNAGVISTLMAADYDTFNSMVANATWAQVKANKDQYSGAEVTPLSKEWKIGVLRDDATSEEALAYEAYLTYLAGEMGFTITFSESTGGNATNEVNQVQTWASAGYDAVILLSSGSRYDVASACQSAGMTVINFASHPEDKDLPDLRSLDSYLGAVGPARYNEAEAGYRLAKHFIDAGYTDFSVFGGSIMFGAEQHAYRVAGMIVAMIEAESGVPNGVFN